MHTIGRKKLQNSRITEKRISRMINFDDDAIFIMYIAEIQWSLGYSSPV